MSNLLGSIVDYIPLLGESTEQVIPAIVLKAGVGDVCDLILLQKPVPTFKDGVNYSKLVRRGTWSWPPKRRVEATPA